jgi:hypothetical protein
VSTLKLCAVAVYFDIKSALTTKRIPRNVVEYWWEAADAAVHVFFAMLVPICWALYPIVMPFRLFWLCKTKPDLMRKILVEVYGWKGGAK